MISVAADALSLFVPVSARPGLVEFEFETVCIHRQFSRTPTANACEMTVAVRLQLRQ